MKKKQQSPADQIYEKFITELDKLIPKHYGLQMVITALVNKYYEPKIYEATEIKAARHELAKLVHAFYSDEPGTKPTMQELLDKASEIVNMNKPITETHDKAAESL